MMLNVQLLKSEFVKNGYSQKDIADMLGISTKTLYNKLKKGNLGISEAEILIRKLNLKECEKYFFMLK